jgi:hypothetical protein
MRVFQTLPLVSVEQLATDEWFLTPATRPQFRGPTSAFDLAPRRANFARPAEHNASRNVPDNFLVV